MPQMITEDCEACGKCMLICPEGSVSESDSVFRIDPNKCCDCMSCVDICPTESIVPSEN